MANKIRFCPECGREWAESVIFCMACGERTIEKVGGMAAVSIEPVAVESEKEEVVQIEETPIKISEIEETPVKMTKIEEVKPVKEEKIPDVEDLILAYIRKVIHEGGKESAFIGQIKTLIK